MKTIGIVGGVASGKTFVARCLESLGAVRLDADREGHEVLREPEVEAAARDCWGDRVFDSSGEIDRKQLARLVFDPDSGAAERRFLEQLTHPRIRRRLEMQVERAAASGAPAVVIDAPLLFESGWDEACDVILFVDAPDEMRQSRASSRGWSESQWRVREANQMPLEEKCRRATISIDASASLEWTKAQVRAFWDSQLARNMSN